MGPTFSRDGGSELSKRARARPREDTAEQPDDEGDAGRRHVRIDSAGRGEDAAPDNYAHHDTKGFQRAEIARKSAPLGGWPLSCGRAVADVIIRPFLGSAR